MLSRLRVVLLLVGCAAGCSLSHNPDLPSVLPGDGDGDGDINVGDGDGDGDGDGSGGAGGEGPTVTHMGGGPVGGAGGETTGEGR